VTRSFGGTVCTYIKEQRIAAPRPHRQEYIIPELGAWGLRGMQLDMYVCISQATTWFGSARATEYFTTKGKSGRCEYLFALLCVYVCTYPFRSVAVGGTGMVSSTATAISRLPAFKCITGIYVCDVKNIRGWKCQNKA
jgi:hypothetical protein